MKKPIRYGLAVLGVGLISYSVYYYRHHRLKHDDNKSLEEIMKERADQASGELTTPMGQALLNKNWDELTKQINTNDHPHRRLANSIRALFIQQKIQTFIPADLDHLESLIVDLLEKEPIKDELGYQLLSTQLYRLPLLGPEFQSRKKLEETALKAQGGPYHEQAKRVALSKLVMQGTPPSEKLLKRFEVEMKELEPTQWTTVIDGIRDVKTQDRMNQHVIKSWKTLSADAQTQAFSVFSNSFNPPQNRELIQFALQALNSPSIGLVEGSLRYLSALVDKGVINNDQKKKILESLSKIDNSKKSPFLAEKMNELAKKLQ